MNAPNTPVTAHAARGPAPIAANPHLDQAIQRACARIAPTWPLDRYIAVNPFWALIDSPVASVAAKLQALSGAQLLMPRAWYRQAYREGRLRDEHLEAALEATGVPLSLSAILTLLAQDEPAIAPRARVLDVVDAGRDLSRALSWRAYVTQSVSQFCAAYFDDGQAQLGPAREGGLYATWLRHARVDRGPALLMGAHIHRELAQGLPTTAHALIEAALVALEIPASAQEDYLWSLLLDQNGWASWCAYRRWTARLAGDDDQTLPELLAIRLAWEWLLYQSGGEGLARRWRAAVAGWPQVDAASASARPHDWVLQRAMELAWRAPVSRALPSGLKTARPSGAAVQAVFCIDVRSEVFRRALESTTPAVQTIGFAGFFGVPLEYQPLGAPTARPQLPGLLAPRLRATDTGLSPEAAAQRARNLELAGGWRSFKVDPLGTFTFVEALGLSYAGKLLRAGLGLDAASGATGLGSSAAPEKPRLTGSAAGGPLSLEARCDLAAGMLRGMSLTRDFSRLVLLVGHGSTTTNNPHAAGLDCGACCGQTGEVNARVAAALLNEVEVRRGLAVRGIEVPDSTRFVPALHNTTTDQVELYELDELPPSHRPDVEALETWLRDAGERARAERAPRLGLEAADPAQLRRATQARTTDWAQLRAEWGLADNAAFIVAPREHCRHLNLKGRAFLHEYRHQEDQGYGVLELIMTAPMVVTHWINFQYYASTVDNRRYGSGNKVLHNVVGGHLGVFEGNSGDLRIGLPMQSLHDGQQWVHTPLRLSVFIEAPREAIDGVLGKHAHVGALVDNGWLSLLQIDEREGVIYERRGGRWCRELGPS